MGGLGGPADTNSNDAFFPQCVHCAPALRLWSSIQWIMITSFQSLSPQPWQTSKRQLLRRLVTMSIF